MKKLNELFKQGVHGTLFTDQFSSYFKQISKESFIIDLTESFTSEEISEIKSIYSTFYLSDSSLTSFCLPENNDFYLELLDLLEEAIKERSKTRESG